MLSKEIKFLLTHSSIYGIGTVVSRLVAFILLPFYTRHLTPSDYGFLETIDISTGLIGIVVTVGIARALSRFYYVSSEQDERNRVVSTTYITYLIVAIISIPFLYFLCNPLSKLLFGSIAYSYLFKISFASLILGGIVDIGLMYLRLIKKPKVFISITIFRVTLLITLNIFFIAYLKLGVLGILYSSLFTRTLVLLLITPSILFRIKLSFSLNISYELLKYAFPIIPSNLANTIVKQSDKYFVLYFLSISDMGIYSIGLKIGNAIHNLLTTPFNMAYIPRRFEKMDSIDSKATFSKIFTYYTFITIYIGLLISVLTPEILSIMVTKDFQRAGLIVPLVVFSMIILGTHFHFDFGILYSKKTKYLAYINLFCAVLHLICNFLLIKSFGLFGAVFSSIIVLSIQACFLYTISQRFFPIIYEFGRIFKFLIFAFVAFFLSKSFYLNNFFLSILFKLLLLSIYTFSLSFFNFLNFDEKKG
jgi:O-antigen/teichoic acid export membrane protein